MVVLRGGTFVISKTNREVDVSGIDGHELNNLDIVPVGGIVKSQRGEVIAIMHQYIHVPNGVTIYSCIQLKSFKNHEDDKSICLQQGQQALSTLDGYTVALDFINGLAYSPIRPFTDNKYESLPHIVLASDVEWDPSISDKTISNNTSWHDSIPNNNGNNNFNDFTTTGELCNNSIVLQKLYEIHDHVTFSSTGDFEKYKKYFLHVPATTIAKTFTATTQYARSGWITGDITNTFKSPFPALNVYRRNKDVATDTIYSTVLAVGDGSTYTQFNIDSK